MDLEGIAEAAGRFAAEGERLGGVLAAEPAPGRRTYLCAYESAAGRSWLALDAGGEPVESRWVVRDAASIAALVELAADAAGGGQLEELRSQLVALRLRENPPGIDEAEEAALSLEHVVGAPPRLATPALLDEIGAATRRLEVALGTAGGSPFAEAMKAGTAAVEALVAEIEAGYKAPLR
ncbi:MAG: hypothetical protein ICV67_03945 [Thermoleophilia bacterium]|nr:hypothetical protein [Thermoleophilia bacterium]